jgi:hypothetical protein
MYPMMQKLRLSMLVVILTAVGCSPDSTSAPNARPIGGPINRSTTSAWAEATPVTMTIFPNEIVADGTNTTTGRVNVDSTVGCCDRIVSVTSNNPSVLPFLSSSATVSAGTSFAAVQIAPTAVKQRTVVTISVTGNGVTVSADVILDPPGTTIQPTLSSFTVDPTTIQAGATAIGTVTIPKPAPAGGVFVNLSSRQPGTASVPSSVTVAEGTTSVSFPVTTFVGFPNSTSCVRLIATTDNSLVEADPCVVTGGTTALVAPSLIAPSADRRFSRGTTVLFDWSDVTGAASYQLQIDDRDTFSAPLILDRTVTVSQLSTSELPATRMFWRVRAISSSGATGPWSVTRRFEIK